MSEWEPRYDPRSQRPGGQQWPPRQGPPWGQPQPPQPQPRWSPPGQPSFQPRQQPPPQAPPQPQPAPPPAAPAPAARKQEKKRKPVAGCIGFLVIATVIGVIIAVLEGGSSPSPFKATVGGYVVINPADLAVTVHVTNTGKTAATPTCTVEASDASYAYTGFDEGTLDSPVPAGQTDTYVDNVTITHEGAQYITSVTVTC